jgi:hypothetical protein
VRRERAMWRGVTAGLDLVAAVLAVLRYGSVPRRDLGLLAKGASQTLRGCLDVSAP